MLIKYKQTLVLNYTHNNYYLLAVNINAFFNLEQICFLVSWEGWKYIYCFFPCPPFFFLISVPLYFTFFWKLIKFYFKKFWYQTKNILHLYQKTVHHSPCIKANKSGILFHSFWQYSRVNGSTLFCFPVFYFHFPPITHHPGFALVVGMALLQLPCLLSFFCCPVFNNLTFQFCFVVLCCLTFLSPHYCWKNSVHFSHSFANVWMTTFAHRDHLAIHYLPLLPWNLGKVILLYFFHT